MLGGVGAVGVLRRRRRCSASPRWAGGQGRAQMSTFKQQYKRLKVLGQGAFGIAYLVQQRESGGVQHAAKEVHLSHMSFKEREATKLEAGLLRNLSHPNVIGYVDSFLEGSKLYIIMEYADGGDLAGRIRACREDEERFRESGVMLIFTQVMLAVQYVHGRKVLHRDIKPLNIFCTKQGAVKLGDFGIARVLEGSANGAQTQIGTPYYISPEVCKRDTYGTKSDLWAVGVVAYELAALRVPFHAQSLPGVAIAICDREPDPIPSVYSKELSAIIFGLLRKDPAKRLSMQEVLREPPVQRYIRKVEQRFMSTALPEDIKVQHHVEYERPCHAHAVVERGHEPEPELAAGLQAMLAAGKPTAAAVAAWNSALFDEDIGERLPPRRRSSKESATPSSEAERRSRDEGCRRLSEGGSECGGGERAPAGKPRRPSQAEALRPAGKQQRASADGQGQALREAFQWQASQEEARHNEAERVERHRQREQRQQRELASERERARFAELEQARLAALEDRKIARQRMLSWQAEAGGSSAPLRPAGPERRAEERPRHAHEATPEATPRGQHAQRCVRSDARKKEELEQGRLRELEEARLAAAADRRLARERLLAQRSEQGERYGSPRDEAQPRACEVTQLPQGLSLCLDRGKREGAAELTSWPCEEEFAGHFDAPHPSRASRARAESPSRFEPPPRSRQGEVAARGSRASRSPSLDRGSLCYSQTMDASIINERTGASERGGGTAADAMGSQRSGERTRLEELERARLAALEDRRLMRDRVLARQAAEEMLGAEPVTPLSNEGSETPSSRVVDENRVPRARDNGQVMDRKASEKAKLEALERARLEAAEDRRSLRERMLARQAEEDEEASSPAHSETISDVVTVVDMGQATNHKASERAKLEALERARLEALDDRRRLRARMQARQDEDSTGLDPLSNDETVSDIVTPVSGARLSVGRTCSWSIDFGKCHDTVVIEPSTQDPNDEGALSQQETLRRRPKAPSDPPRAPDESGFLELPYRSRVSSEGSSADFKRIRELKVALPGDSPAAACSADDDHGRLVAAPFHSALETLSADSSKLESSMLVCSSKFEDIHSPDANGQEVALVLPEMSQPSGLDDRCALEGTLLPENFAVACSTSAGERPAVDDYGMNNNSSGGGGLHETTLRPADARHIAHRMPSGSIGIGTSVHDRQEEARDLRARQAWMPQAEAEAGPALAAEASPTRLPPAQTEPSTYPSELLEADPPTHPAELHLPCSAPESRRSALDVELPRPPLGQRPSAAERSCSSTPPRGGPPPPKLDHAWHQVTASSARSSPTRPKSLATEDAFENAEARRQVEVDKLDARRQDFLSQQRRKTEDFLRLRSLRTQPGELDCGPTRPPSDAADAASEGTGGRGGASERSQSQRDSRGEARLMEGCGKEIPRGSMGFIEDRLAWSDRSPSTAAHEAGAANTDTESPERSAVRRVSSAKGIAETLDGSDRSPGNIAPWVRAADLDAESPERRTVRRVSAAAIGVAQSLEGTADEALRTAASQALRSAMAVKASAEALQDAVPRSSLRTYSYE